MNEAYAMEKEVMQTYYIRHFNYLTLLEKDGLHPPVRLMHVLRREDWQVIL